LDIKELNSMEILIIAVAVVAFLKLLQWAKESKDEITCPICGASQCTAVPRGGGLTYFWIEYFCYRCQKYFS